MHTNIKTKNRKELQLQALVDSGCTYTGIDKQLVKEEKIKTESIDKSFEVFNANGTKNGEVTRFALLKVEINGHKEQIDVVVMDLNGIDMFLGYDWLVKHNPEIDWSKGIMQFMRCSRIYRTNHQNISFIPRNQKIQAIDDNNKEQQEIGKKPDPTNPKDLPDYIRPFIHLFNKKKFEKLPERQEWDHEINLMEKTPRELNEKAYTMIIKENEALNQ